MLKNAQRHHDNPEFQQDMLLTVESSLEKMRQMMAQLREGDKPVVGASSGVDLPAVLSRLEAMARARGRELEVEIVDRVATRGHTQRLERVLGHVVQNALEATPVSGRVWVSLRQSVGRASVTIGDTGSGMSPEFIQSQLFRPFSSTKQSGMGIGTYESYQYIKELGGSISVDSELGRGTVVSILLPLFDMQIRSDLQMSAAP
jgi:putative PEP-CTERM system histidine kinase